MGFAFEMFFDKQSEKKIKFIWQKLIDNNLPSFMIENNCKPHISLSVYKDIDINIATKMLKKFCAKRSNFKLYLGFIGTFISKENVIFVAPGMQYNLKNIHDAFHKDFKLFENSVFDYYLPNNWQPHCTLAIEIPENQYIQSFNIIRKHFKSMEVSIKSIGLVEFTPTKLITEFKLK